MVEVEYNGKKVLSFLVRRGDVNLIIIPIDGLLPVDYRRLSNLEAQGGEMMRVMRDTTLDNGKNALAMYEPLFKIVPIKEKSVDAPAEGKQILMEEGKDAAPVKRGRGRPKGSGKKAAAKKV
jgi:hypothetical protein